MSVPEPLAIASFAMPAAALASQRNVFAFNSVEDRRSRLSLPSPVVEEKGQVRVPDVHRETITPPSARFLGSFGPQETPILVYKDNGEVVNVPVRRP